MGKEQLFDFSTAVHLADVHGERFEGWFLFKTPLKKESHPLNYKDTDLTFQFILSDYNCRFVMPVELEFIEGKISYTEGERKLGVFRFPRDDKGNFAAPCVIKKEEIEIMMDFSEEELKRVLISRKPLVFNAFQIPQFGFEFIDISDYHFKEIEKLTDLEFTALLRDEQSKIIDDKIVEIKEKILFSPNYLLILKNTLNRQWKNLAELAVATNKIIHI